MAIDKNSNRYIISYAVIMIVIVAFVLSVVSMSLQERQQANVLLEKQSNILSSVGISTTPQDRHTSRADFVRSQFDNYIIDSYAVNGKGERVDDADVFELLDNIRKEFAKPDSERLLPLFVARTDTEDRLYIFPVFGAGLWGPIWGYVALKHDLNTVFGVNFDHDSETPGLGAEISTPAFWNHFPGKQIFDTNETFVSIHVLRGTGASAGKINAVDGISGGTITSQGIQRMLYNSLSLYMPFIERVRQKMASMENTGTDASAGTNAAPDNINENNDRDNERQSQKAALVGRD